MSRLPDISTQRIAMLGAAGGIGSTIATRLARNGDQICLLDLAESRDTLAPLLDSYPRNTHFIAIDLRDPVSIQQAFSCLSEHTDRLDACINAAGVIHRGSFVDTSHEHLMRIMEINVSGPFMALQQAVHLMSGGGRIVNLASAHGLRTGTERTAYAMSKGAILSLTRALAVELGPQGILVNAVAPGPVSSGMQDVSSQSRQRWLSTTPLERVATANEVATAVLQLVSTSNTFITGQTLVIDGGASVTI